jgi:SAM-dependent methyltransferase
MRRHANRQAAGRSWRIWDLDAEMRYWPVVDALPAGEAPVCEIGSGPAGLSTWTTRKVIGVDPGSDERHGELAAMPNLERVVGDGAHVPLPDRSVIATVAVDTFEHIPPSSRAVVVDEMTRITAPGGRLVIIGPTGARAADGDRWLLATLRRHGPEPTWAEWLDEHVENGLPTIEEMRSLLRSPRVTRVRTAGYLNVWLWRAMHLAAMKGPRLGPAHVPVWAPFARLARRYRRGPYYRWMFVADLA